MSSPGPKRPRFAGTATRLKVETFVFVDFESTGLFMKDTRNPAERTPDAGSNHIDTCSRLRMLCDANLLQLRLCDLSGKASFAEEWPGVRHFLSTLRKPACLIAHNGVYFDFRLLKMELDRYKIPIDERLPEGVYFIDSWLAFRDIDHKWYHDTGKIVSSVDWGSLLTESPVCSQEEEVDASGAGDAWFIAPAAEEEPPSTVALGGNLSTSVPPSPNATSPPVTDLTKLRAPSSAGASCSWQKEEEGADEKKTPQKIPSSSKIDTTVSSGGRNLFGPVESPVRHLNTTQWSPARRKKMARNEGKLYRMDASSRRVLFDSGKAGHLIRTGGGYSLQALYKDLVANGEGWTQHDNNAHRAQADCLTLMSVCVAYGKDFLKYADDQACEFPY